MRFEIASSIVLKILRSVRTTCGKSRECSYQGRAPYRTPSEHRTDLGSSSPTITDVYEVLGMTIRGLTKPVIVTASVSMPLFDLRHRAGIISLEPAFRLRTRRNDMQSATQKVNDSSHPDHFSRP